MSDISFQKTDTNIISQQTIKEKKEYAAQKKDKEMISQQTFKERKEYAASLLEGNESAVSAGVLGSANITMLAGGPSTLDGEESTFGGLLEGGDDVDDSFAETATAPDDADLDAAEQMALRIDFLKQPLDQDAAKQAVERLDEVFARLTA